MTYLNCVQIIIWFVTVSQLQHNFSWQAIELLRFFFSSFLLRGRMCPPKLQLHVFVTLTMLFRWNTGESEVEATVLYHDVHFYPLIHNLLVRNWKKHCFESLLRQSVFIYLYCIYCISVTYQLWFAFFSNSVALGDSQIKCALQIKCRWHAYLKYIFDV